MAASSAVQSDLLDQIEELRGQVTIEEAEARKSLSEYQGHLAKRKETLERMAELAKKAADAEPNFDMNGAAPHAAAPAPKHRGGRPAKAAKGVAAKHKPTKGAKGRGGRMYGQGKSLPMVVWEILDRKPSALRKLLPDMPKDAVGLRIVEIRDVISMEGEWKSSSENIAPQIQQALKKFSEQGKVARDEDQKRWFIVEGAELDGPSLDEDGNPIEE